jgi:hypothetical protein
MLKLIIIMTGVGFGLIVGSASAVWADPQASTPLVATPHCSLAQLICAGTHSF